MTKQKVREKNELRKRNREKFELFVESFRVSASFKYQWFFFTFPVDVIAAAVELTWHITF